MGVSYERGTPVRPRWAWRETFLHPFPPCIAKKLTVQAVPRQELTVQAMPRQKLTVQAVPRQLLPVIVLKATRCETRSSLLGGYRDTSLTRNSPPPPGPPQGPRHIATVES